MTATIIPNGLAPAQTPATSRPQAQTRVPGDFLSALSEANGSHSKASETAGTPRPSHRTSGNSLPSSSGHQDQRVAEPDTSSQDVTLGQGGSTSGESPGNKISGSRSPLQPPVPTGSSDVTGATARHDDETVVTHTTAKAADAGGSVAKPSKPQEAAGHSSAAQLRAQRDQPTPPEQAAGTPEKPVETHDAATAGAHDRKTRTLLPQPASTTPGTTTGAAGFAQPDTAQTTPEPKGSGSKGESLRDGAVKGSATVGAASNLPSGRGSEQTVGRESSAKVAGRTVAPIAPRPQAGSINLTPNVSAATGTTLPSPATPVSASTTAATLSAGNAAGLAAAIRQLVTDGGGAVRLTLHPASLGQILVDVRTTSAGSLGIRIETATENTRGMIASGVQSLSAQLNAAGFVLGSLQVVHGQAAVPSAGTPANVGVGVGTFAGGGGGSAGSHGQPRAAPASIIRERTVQDVAGMAGSDGPVGGVIAYA